MVVPSSNPNYWFPSEAALKADEKGAGMNVPLGITTEEGWNEVEGLSPPCNGKSDQLQERLANGVIFQSFQLEHPSFDVRECTY